MITTSATSPSKIVTRPADVTQPAAPPAPGSIDYFAHSVPAMIPIPSAYLGRLLRDMGASHIPGTNIMVGSARDLYSLDALRKNEITHVLMVESEGDHGELTSTLKPLGIQVRTSKVVYDLEGSLLAELPRVIQYVRDVGQSGGRVLIGGGSGTCRAVGIAVGYLMSEMAEAYQRNPVGPIPNFYGDALKVVQEARSRSGVDAIPSLGITLELMEYNQQLGGQEN